MWAKSALSRPLLGGRESRSGRESAGSASPASHPVGPGIRRLRRAVVCVLARLRLESAPTSEARPTLEAARDYMRFFLAKDTSGGLLSLNCSESAFSAHAGSGVAIYMQFVKMTGWMFFVATLIVIPQFIANIRGDALGLVAPWHDHEKTCAAECGNGNLLQRFVCYVSHSAAYLLYASFLANVSFKRQPTAAPSAARLHLSSELLLSCMFCIYVFWIWRHSVKVLEELDSKRLRASDFAIKVPATHPCLTP